MTNASPDLSPPFSRVACDARSAARLALLILALCAMTPTLRAQQWTDRVRGSWVGDATSGGVTLVSNERLCDIVVAPTENSCVKQAAVFLAGDIEKISGHKPAIIERQIEGHPSIVLFTLPGDGDDAKWPWPFARGAWEAYAIRTIDQNVYLAGSNPRGTAFAAYTLSERLGVDPLYHWTGYVPDHHDPLILKPTDFSSGPPTFRYRGMFHDDEDILPRPFETSGYPLRTGDVPTEWYAKYFETALRLRMNMVAPYTRVHRRYEVQKMASDWGLFYTSHHYDILLSNPFGMDRYGLAKARGVSGAWDWINNRDGMLRYWRGGVEENKDINCIWPVGLRGTDDYGYRFPPSMSEDEQSKIFKDLIVEQVKMARELLPKDRTPIFHWTLYTEMLPKYQSGKLQVPDDVIIVWPDDNDGTMRGLPTQKDRWKHGVYYHLAYLGKQVKQNAHIVPPSRIAEQFRKVVDSGAIEYMLVNVSELREFIMEARMLAEICWDAKTALAGDDPAKRYVDWWCREYFPAASAGAAIAYANYDVIFRSYDLQWAGSDCLHHVLSGETKLNPNESERPVELSRAGEVLNNTLAKLPWPQSQFFFDHVVLPVRFEQRPFEAAALFAKGEREKAIEPLEKLETEILRAEHPPFEHWYRETWIRRGPKQWNVHRPYEEMRLYLSTGGKKFELPDPEPRRRATTAATLPSTRPER
jgi:hypothetical protein